MKNTKIKIALIQSASKAAAAANLKNAAEKIRQAASRGAKIICLQELFLGDYFCQTQNTKNFGLAEMVPGPTTQALAAAAKAAQVVIIVPLFEKQAEGLYYNTAAVIDADGQFLGKYRKMHIPDDPNFQEKFYFAPGDLGFKVFKTKYGNIGVLICWDQWFPEAARLTALQGADIIFYPTAIGYSQKDKAIAAEQISGWETVQRAHAVANQVFVAAVNRVGREKKITFWGNSFVAGPFGEVIAKAGARKEQILFADCDLAQIKETREGWPFFRDRRVDAYKGITERFLNEKLPSMRVLTMRQHRKAAKVESPSLRARLPVRQARRSNLPLNIGLLRRKERSSQ